MPFEELTRSELIEIIVSMQSRLDALEKENAGLKRQSEQLKIELAKARKDSSNSSKPPSSDITKPPKPEQKGKRGRKKKRKIGGQPGHPRHEREPFPPDKIDRVEEHNVERCPVDGTKLDKSKTKTRVIQQVSLPEKLFIVTEHHQVGRWCKRCGEYHYAPLPGEVKKGGLFDSRMTAFVAYMKGACHASYSTIEAFLRNVGGLDVSRGMLAKQISKVTAALDEPYEELLSQLPNEARVNADETGHKENGDKFWTWVFRAASFALFRIDESRGSKVLIEVLGEEFNGVLGCDFFSAYRKYMKDFNIIIQFCLAHLIRDVKFLTALPDKVTANYGERVLDGLRRLFRVIHRREKMSEKNFQRALEREQKKLVATAKRAPARSEAQNMAKRFRKHGKAYFEFITTPGVQPTNNLAEQAIRFVVIDRKVTQGTRSAAGRRWCERIWTVLATCTMQAKSAFDYLCNAIQAHFTGQPIPSLIFDSS